MPSAGDGNYCGKCDKIVIDFTSYSDEELHHYFVEKKEQRICGHFKKSQVKLPKLKFSQTRFLAAVFLVFGSLLFSSSCGFTAGEPMDTQADGGVVMLDSTYEKIDSVDNESNEDAGAAYHISKEDSTRISDSVARTKNSIRDFN